MPDRTYGSLLPLESPSSSVDKLKPGLFSFQSFETFNSRIKNSFWRAKQGFQALQL